VEPGEVAIFEDGLYGVAALRCGEFGFVLGINRVRPADELRAHEADRVVNDLAQLSPPADTVVAA
jgi:beta-phosphoglucomutase-like phosphatase (HAD superfamily)